MNPVLHAADVLLRGGIIAYPTEGVFGLGCLPDNEAALIRLLEIKNRDANKGLILIAADAGQFVGWIKLPADASLPSPEPTAPITWIVPAGHKATQTLRGDHATLAVRLTTNPVAKSLCVAARSPLVSTSANLGGQPSVLNQAELQQQFAGVVDYIVPGDCGPASGPSEIRDFVSGQVLRPRTS